MVSKEHQMILMRRETACAKQSPPKPPKYIHDICIYKIHTMYVYIICALLSVCEQFKKTSGELYNFRWDLLSLSKGT